jgi:hypothetical protein
MIRCNCKFLLFIRSSTLHVCRWASRENEINLMWKKRWLSFVLHCRIERTLDFALTAWRTIKCSASNFAMSNETLDGGGFVLVSVSCKRLALYARQSRFPRLVYSQIMFLKLLNTLRSVVDWKPSALNYTLIKHWHSFRIDRVNAAIRVASLSLADFHSPKSRNSS